MAVVIILGGYIAVSLHPSSFLLIFFLFSFPLVFLLLFSFIFSVFFSAFFFFFSSHLGSEGVHNAFIRGRYPFAVFFFFGFSFFVFFRFSSYLLLFFFIR